MKNTLFLTFFLSILSFSTLFAQEKKDSTVSKIDSSTAISDTLINKIETNKQVENEKKSKKNRKNEKEVAVAVDSTLSYSEEYKRDKIKTAFGVRGGATLGRFLVDKSEVLQLQANGFPIIPFVKEELLTNQQNVIGYSGGVFMRIIKGSFYWQPEVDYTVRGGKFDILQKNGSVRRIESKFTSIDVPMVFGIRFRQGRIFAGPSAIFQFQFSDNLLNTLKTYTTTPDDLKGNLFQRPSFGFVGGLGFEFKKIFIEGRYDAGLSNFTNYNLGISSNPAKFVMRPQGFQLTLGFLTR